MRLRALERRNLMHKQQQRLKFECNKDSEPSLKDQLQRTAYGGHHNLNNTA